MLTFKAFRRTGCALAAATLAAAACPRGNAQQPASWQQLPFTGFSSAFPTEMAAGRWNPAWALEVKNVNGGTITLHQAQQPARMLGKVLRPARRMARTGFYAGFYARGGTVVASARKTLRIRGPGPAATDRIGIGKLRNVPIVSLAMLPRDWELGFESPAERAAIERESPLTRSHVWTDCAAELFGEWAPPVGSPVFYREGNAWKPLAELKQTAGTTPAAPSHLLIVVFRPERRPHFLEMENWSAETLKAWRKNPGPVGSPPEELPVRDGRARAVWDEKDLESSVFGSVYQRVQAVGRLDDTGIARPGQVCTIHPGDVAISTSTGLPRPIKNKAETETLSGFQIVPANHARDGMVDDKGRPGYAIGHGVWMIVGPEQPEQVGNTLLRKLIGDHDYRIRPELEGTAPLFAGYLSPRYFPEEDRVDAVPSVRRGHMVRISCDWGKTWQRLPTLRATPAVRIDGLRRVTHVRIYLPTEAAL